MGADGDENYPFYQRGIPLREFDSQGTFRQPDQRENRLAANPHLTVQACPESIHGNGPRQPGSRREEIHQVGRARCFK